jgi:hypothetical protein
MKAIVAVIFLTICFQGKGLSQRTFKVMNEKSSLLAQFPQIPGCERDITSLSTENRGLEYTVTYERIGTSIDRKDPNYFGCGSISVRVAPGIRKEALQNIAMFGFLTSQLIKINGFDAVQTSPLCGNDPWIGSYSVYFNEDKVLIVSANVPNYEILKYASNADYKSLKSALNEAVKNAARGS